MNLTLGKNILDMLATSRYKSIHEILEKCLEGRRILKEDAYNLINSVDCIEGIVDTARKMRDRIKIRSNYLLA